MPAATKQHESNFNEGAILHRIATTFQKGQYINTIPNERSKLGRKI